MKMRFPGLSLLVLFPGVLINYSNAITSEEIVARLECVEHCHRNYHRSCNQVPHQCGNCTHSYHEVSGVCMRINEGRHGRIYDPNLVTSEHGTVYHGGMKKAVLMKARDQGEGFLGSVVERRRESEDEYWDIIIIGILCSASVVLFISIVLTIACVCKVKSNKLNSEMPYQTFYGTTLKAPNHPAANGDRKLAYSAQMYHYQYQKQQMLANEKVNGFDHKNPSGNSTDDELVDDDDDTVYECPGLANTEGEMEVANPYFVEMSTPNEPSTAPPAKQP